MKRFVILFFAVMLAACSRSGLRQVNRSFYYWKTNFQLSRSELDTLQELGVKRMYVKFFDVVWENGPTPVSQVEFVSRPPALLTIVPTVFITNETLTRLADAAVPELADRIDRKLQRLIAGNGLQHVPEIQIDCDWTTGTREKYFALLRRLRAQLAAGKTLLSATIRLHQVKYRSQTGVPPVDRGMLMFYNLAPLTSFKTENSIIDLTIGKSYTATLGSYPLPLDVALPVYAWGVVFQDNRFICLVNGITRAEVKSNVFAPYGGNYYQVRSDVYLHHTQLYAGDLVRVEESDYGVCLASANYLAQMLGTRGRFNVALFHFDQENLRRWSHAQTQRLFAGFR